MTDQAPLNLSQIDQAYERAMADSEGAASLLRLGHHHGVRLMRQRLGGQFLRNQAHIVTPDQLKEVEDTLSGEIARHEAPSPELTAASVREHADYWRGFESGVACYRTHLSAPVPAPTSARRPRP